jgi:hypothetical protein
VALSNFVDLVFNRTGIGIDLNADGFVFIGVCHSCFMAKPKVIGKRLTLGAARQQG